MLDKDLSDEVRVTVIATGLNGETKQDHDSIPHTMKTDYLQSRAENVLNEDGEHVPSFRDAKQQIGEPDKNTSMFEDEDANGDSSEGPVITFGDDLDVPAFIRNRQE